MTPDIRGLGNGVHHLKTFSSCAASTERGRFLFYGTFISDTASAKRDRLLCCKASSNGITLLKHYTIPEIDRPGHFVSGSLGAWKLGLYSQNKLGYRFSFCNTIISWLVDGDWQNL